MTSCLRTASRLYSTLSHEPHPFSSQTISQRVKDALALSPEAISQAIHTGDMLERERALLQDARRECESALKYPGLVDLPTDSLTKQLTAIKEQQSLIDWTITSKN